MEKGLLKTGKQPCRGRQHAAITMSRTLFGLFLPRIAIVIKDQITNHLL